MTDKGAKSIGEALGTVKRTNTKLVTLNLAGNQISDQGAIDIANVCQWLLIYKTSFLNWISLLFNIPMCLFLSSIWIFIYFLFIYFFFKLIFLLKIFPKVKKKYFFIIIFLNNLFTNISDVQHDWLICRYLSIYDITVYSLLFPYLVFNS